MKEATVAEPITKSLAQILDVLKSIDDDMPPDEFDPAVVVGDLRDKVDAIKWRLDQWDSAISNLADWSAQLNKRAKAINGKIERLEDYVKHCMARDGLDLLPGNMMQVRLQRGAPSYVYKEPASPETYEKYPGFVKVETERKYQWEKELIKNLLRDGEPLDFAEIRENSHIKFYAKGTK